MHLWDETAVFCAINNFRAKMLDAGSDRDNRGWNRLLQYVSSTYMIVKFKRWMIDTLFTVNQINIQNPSYRRNPSARSCSVFMTRGIVWPATAFMSDVSRSKQGMSDFRTCKTRRYRSMVSINCVWRPELEQNLVEQRFSFTVQIRTKTEKTSETKFRDSLQWLDRTTKSSRITVRLQARYKSTL